MTIQTMTSKTFVSGLNMLRLRFQDIQRDLVALSDKAAADGVLGAESTIGMEAPGFDEMYELFLGGATAVDHDFNDNPWSDISNPEALGALLTEEFDQAMEKAHEMADMAKLDPAYAQILLEDVGYGDFPLNVLSIIEDKGLAENIKASMDAGFTSADGEITRQYTDYVIKSVVHGEDSVTYGVYFTFDTPIEMVGTAINGFAEAYIIS